MNILPAITLYQPWATWILRGWKTIETRTHNRFACLRNRTILIHSGMRTDISLQVTDNPYLTLEQIYQTSDEPGGFILGSARVHDYRELIEEDSECALIECGGAVKRFGLFLQDITPFEKPIPVKGGMGIWYFNLDTNQKVKISNEQKKEIGTEKA